MKNTKTHSENGKVVMSEKTMSESEDDSGLQFLMSKDKTLQQLRECAENVKEGKASHHCIIPDNSFRLEPGIYTGEELGAVIYFIADMLE